MPPSRCSATAARCVIAPGVGIAIEIPAGCSRARRTSSGSERMPAPGWATKSCGTSASGVTGSRSRAASKGRRPVACQGSTVRPLVLATNSVQPSAGALATASQAGIVMPPERFSTTCGWPLARASCSASARASRSIGPPATTGTTRRTVPPGQAAAGPARHSSAAMANPVMAADAPARIGWPAALAARGRPDRRGIKRRYNGIAAMVAAARAAAARSKRSEGAVVGATIWLWSPFQPAVPSGPPYPASP